MQLILLGTGSSAAVPDIACVTSQSGGCECCRKALTPEGRHNVRGNTGAILRIKQGDGSEKTILIDCGKTFREQALKWFPKHGLRKIDACFLTHHHADAIDGLDDLRAWTYQSAIESTIPIYCSSATYKQIERGFEYLVDKEAASGSGAVPSFHWEIIEESEPIHLFGVEILPLPVHHGVYFTSPPHPLLSLAFLIDSAVLYCSDVSYIPETTWTRLNKALALPPQHEAHTQSAKTKPRLQALIIDGHCLQLSKSHFGFPQAVATARRLGVERTYLTNLPHMVSHECWTYCCKKFSESGKQKAQPSASSPAWVKWNESRKQRSFASSHQGFDPFAEDWAVFAQRAIEAVADWEGPELARGEQPWVRPAADGLVLDWTAKREPQGRKLHEDAYR